MGSALPTAYRLSGGEGQAFAGADPHGAKEDCV